jgi:hypothetical protein
VCNWAIARPIPNGDFDSNLDIWQISAAAR